MSKSNKFNDARFDKTLEFKNEQWYAKRLQVSYKEFKASECKLFNFEMNCENTCRSVYLLEKEIISINNQVQRLNNGGGASLYPLPLFCNPIAPMKRSFDLNTCPLCGLWYACNFITIECGHTFHSWCMATHVASSLKCVISDCDFYFTKQWCTTWGIRVLGNANVSRIFGSTPFIAQNNKSLLKDPMFIPFGMRFHYILQFLFFSKIYIVFLILSSSLHH